MIIYLYFQKDAGEGTSKQSCSVCGVLVTMLQQTPKGSMCGTCYTHFKYVYNYILVNINLLY